MSIRIINAPTVAGGTKTLYSIVCNKDDTKPVNWEKMASGSVCQVLDDTQGSATPVRVFKFLEVANLGDNVYGKWIEI